MGAEVARATAKKKAPARKPAKRAAAKPKPAPRPPGFVSDVLNLRHGLRASFEAKLARGISEERLLAYLLLTCLCGFVAGLPAAFRLAEGMDADGAFIGLVAGRFVAVVIFGALFLYALAGLSHWFSAWGFGGTGTYPKARLALFWALLIGVPLSLLQSGVGFVAEELGLPVLARTVGLLIFFFWLWIWTSFLAIAEGFSRAGVFLVVLAGCAAVMGIVWAVDAAAAR